jgi:radical SAM protein with 4Fe4S-binding SPASM domain
VSDSEEKIGPEANLHFSCVGEDLNNEEKVVEFFTDSRKVSRFLSKTDPNAVLGSVLGQRFYDYRRRWDLAKTFRQIHPFPLHVDYELKSVCNLRCPMCLMSRRPQGDRPADPASPQLSINLVKKLIEEGVEAGQASMGFGGLWEPLLAPQLPDLVAFGRQKGLIEAMFNTNGLLLSKDVSKALIEAGLTRIMISLDAATESTYRLVRPGSDFKEVKQNILQLLALRKQAHLKLPLVRLSFCLTSLNESELSAFISQWEGKVDFFSLQYYGRYQPDSPGLFPAGGSVPPPSGRCAQPFKRLLVRHDGQVLPCCDLSALELTMGNVHDKSLRQIWEGKSLKDLRESLLGDEKGYWPACRQCQSKYER